MVMRFVLYTHSYSPHELPLFLECAEIFEQAIYVVDKGWEPDHSRKGWTPNLRGRNTLVLSDLPADQRENAFQKLLTRETAILYGQRGNAYEEMIHHSPAVVLYASERWLKPLAIRIPVICRQIFVPGVSHLFRPQFRRCVRNVRRWSRENPRFFYLAACGRASLGIMLIHKFIVLFLQVKLPFVAQLSHTSMILFWLANFAVLAVSVALSWFATSLIRNLSPWALGEKRKVG